MHSITKNILMALVAMSCVSVNYAASAANRASQDVNQQLEFVIANKSHYSFQYNQQKIVAGQLRGDLQIGQSLKPGYSE